MSLSGASRQLTPLAGGVAHHRLPGHHAGCPAWAAWPLGSDAALCRFWACNLCPMRIIACCPVEIRAGRPPRGC